MKQKLIRSYQQVINASREQIFPLLCPVREKEWLYRWDYKMLYSESGYAEKGCIFETNNDYGSYNWIISKHDTESYELQFVKTAQHLVVLIDIDLKEKSTNESYCNIQYTFIALDDRAVEQLHHEHTLESFNAHMAKWEASLNYYIENNKMLID